MESLLTVADNLELYVTSLYKYAAPKKHQKANPFWSNYFKVQTRSFI